MKHKIEENLLLERTHYLEDTPTTTIENRLNCYVKKRFFLLHLQSSIVPCETKWIIMKNRAATPFNPDDGKFEWQKKQNFHRKPDFLWDFFLSIERLKLNVNKYRLICDDFAWETNESLEIWFVIDMDFVNYMRLNRFFEMKFESLIVFYVS